MDSWRNFERRNDSQEEGIVVVAVQEGLRMGIVHYAVDGRLHVLIPKRAGAWGGLNSPFFLIRNVKFGH
jgi:hypothetical protein